MVAAYVLCVVALVPHRAQSLKKINSEWKQEGAKGLVKVAQSDAGKELATTAVTSAAQAKWGQPDSGA